jgi:RNA polymerase sigma factor (sigma-70 family)
VQDDDIIQLLWERSEAAVSELSDKFGHFCYTIAFNILSNYQDAEECVNDTYMRAWNAIPPTRPRWLPAFLGRIARNIALDRYDYNTAKKRNGQFDLILSELEECISSPADVEQQYAEGEIAAHINTFLHRMNGQDRNIFLRRYWYSDSIADIAGRFGISESKVKSMLFRTRNKLRFFLQKEGIEL